MRIILASPDVTGALSIHLEAGNDPMSAVHFQSALNQIRNILASLNLLS